MESLSNGSQPEIRTGIDSSAVDDLGQLTQWDRNLGSIAFQLAAQKEEEQQSLSSVLELRLFSSDGGQQVRRLMESSVLLCKGCTPWQRLLLTASLLTFWHLSTTARKTTVSVPRRVSEGDDVLFLVRNLPEDIKSLAWFKGQGNTTKKIATYTLHNDLSRRGLAYSNRETIYRNGSMLFEKVTLKDSGFYTLQTYNRRGKIVSTTNVNLNVQAYLWKCGRLSTSSQPRIESVPPSVAEGRSVLLLVRNLPEHVTAFLWFKGENDLKQSLLAFHYFPFEQPVFWGPAYSGKETVNSDGSLLLHSVSQKDRGLYVLRILRIDGKDEEAKVQLQVDSSLSAFCNALTPSRLMIQPVPRYVAEGEDVLLQVHNLPEEAQVISWLKSNDGSPARKFIVYNRTKPSISWGPAKRIRGKVYKTGSLLLQDIIETDAGMYTLEVLNKDSKIERANVEFYLKKPVTQPFVQITDTTVAGGDSVTFTCISPDTDVSIRWIFNNTFLLTFWHLFTIAHETTVSVPPIVSEGDDVLFLVHNLPGDIESLAWFKGLGDEAEEIASYALHSDLSRPGPAHSSRETIYHNGSMLFEKVNLKDTEFYTLRTYNRSGKIVSTANVYLNVYAFLWKCGCLAPSAQTTVESLPSSVAEGGSALLLVHNPPENILEFLWYKGEVDSKNLLATQPVPAKKPTVWGPAYSGRETLHSDGSLLLHDVTEKDHGLYTLRILRTDMGIEEAQVQLQVDKPVTQPFVRITDTTVSGGTSVIFTCVSPNTDVSIRWIYKKKNLQLTERMTLSPTKCGLRIDPVRREDAGEYQCEVSNRFGLKTSLPVSWP
ncbi:pregnancy-specific glycoprotein 22-like [Chionomys nivalis]|uniref:pregnancy-specific glycoprotein 22-like n=1 Tax=Chionomys nivalis TaxID=269649 RepID=UPI002599E80C|nr:pregnancy-specific glycoprotein 22-like [Chionomys nivalis]